MISPARCAQRTALAPVFINNSCFINNSQGKGDHAKPPKMSGGLHPLSRLQKFQGLDVNTHGAIAATNFLGL